MSEKPMDKYDEFFSLAYQPGAMDAKTKHLVALAASLGAGCQPWTEYCLAVARKHGASRQEIDEVLMDLPKNSGSKKENASLSPESHSHVLFGHLNNEGGTSYDAIRLFL